MAKSKMVFPAISNLADLIKEVKKVVRRYGEDRYGGGAITLTVGADGKGRKSWSFQTGDNSFTGGAYLYPHWAVVEVESDSNSDELARSIVDQLEEAAHG